MNDGISNMHSMNMTIESNWQIIDLQKHLANPYDRINSCHFIEEQISRNDEDWSPNQLVNLCDRINLCHLMDEQMSRNDEYWSSIQLDNLCDKKTQIHLTINFI